MHASGVMDFVRFYRAAPCDVISDVIRYGACRKYRDHMLELYDACVDGTPVTSARFLHRHRVVSRLFGLQTMSVPLRLHMIEYMCRSGLCVPLIREICSWLPEKPNATVAILELAVNAMMDTSSELHILHAIDDCCVIPELASSGLVDCIVNASHLSPASLEYAIKRFGITRVHFLPVRYYERSLRFLRLRYDFTAADVSRNCITDALKQHRRAAALHELRFGYGVRMRSDAKLHWHHKFTPPEARRMASIIGEVTSKFIKHITKPEISAIYAKTVAC